MEERIPKFYLAPMVRYSKLPFRQLVRLYGVDVCYTPMIYAKNFIDSEFCRMSEFTTCKDDNPVIVQFATDDPIIFANAAELVSKYANGVDLNCGCPKQDVRSKGFGSSLLNKPELLADMVKQTRARVADPDFSVSLKIRISHPIERTVDLCRKAEHAGVTHLTVHGRTPYQRNEPIDVEAIRLINDSVSVNIIANGGVTTLQEALQLSAQTGAHGIMAADGILTNPAMFSGCDTVPQDCVVNFMNLSRVHGLDWMLYHQHLQYMLRPVLSSQQRRIFNELHGRTAIDDFLQENVL